jgi:hypothetical protein
MGSAFKKVQGKYVWTWIYQIVNLTSLTLFQLYFELNNLMTVINYCNNINFMYDLWLYLVSHPLTRASMCNNMAAIDLTGESRAMYEDLRNFGCCERCCLRYLGARNPESYRCVKAALVEVCCFSCLPSASFRVYLTSNLYFEPLSCRRLDWKTRNVLAVAQSKSFRNAIRAYFVLDFYKKSFLPMILWSR